MSDSKPSLERLPAPTQARLRSTQILTSLPQLISELLQNALDAGSTQIEIGLNAPEWMCWVTDNGHGIGKDDLENMGCGDDQNRYRTSKSYVQGQNTNSSFGFRGEALASAADVSCLEISSRTTKSPNTWAVIVKGSKLLYFGPATRWKRGSQGTTVCIRDAFYNLPVRRRSHPATNKTWDLVCREIEIYSLVFPHVSFSLEDLSKSPSSTQHTERIFRIHSARTTLAAFKRLYGGAYTEHIYEVDVEHGSFKIHGFFSMVGATSKSYQFLYINRHPIVNCEFHRAIDARFASSTFSKHALDENGEANLPRATTRRSPRKLEKKAVYVLDITVPSQDLDNHLDPAKTTVHLRNGETIVSVLSQITQDFLRKNGFVPLDGQTRPSEVDMSTSSPHKRRRTADVERMEDLDLGDPPFIGSSLQDAKRLSEPRSISASSPGTGQPPLPPDLYAAPTCPSHDIFWNDAHSGRQFIIDSRTGHSFRQPSTLSKDGDHSPAPESRRTVRYSIPVSSVEEAPQTRQQTPAWLERALSVNNTYYPAESDIRTIVPTQFSIKAPDGPMTYSQHNLQPSLKQRSRMDIYDMAQHLERNLDRHNCTRADLRQAAIINQIDEKFIACIILPQESRHLQGSRDEDAETPVPKVVLVDQHAADERVRVERFLKELCSGFLASFDQTIANDAKLKPLTIKELVPPAPVLMTRHEALTIDRSPDILKLLQKWGIHFVKSSEPSKIAFEASSEFGSSSEYSQLLVSSIPDLLSEKLLQGDELRDLLKGTLNQIQSGELVPDFQLEVLADSSNEFGWLKALRYCPKGLVELVNSKACRGAIMFNDPLSIPRCERLIRELSETAFPFQCAHGRPSLIPLVDSRILLSGYHKRRRPVHDWSRVKDDQLFSCS